MKATKMMLQRDKKNKTHKPADGLSPSGNKFLSQDELLTLCTARGLEDMVKSCWSYDTLETTNTTCRSSTHLTDCHQHFEITVIKKLNQIKKPLFCGDSCVCLWWWGAGWLSRRTTLMPMCHAPAHETADEHSLVYPHRRLHTVPGLGSEQAWTKCQSGRLDPCCSTGVSN